MTNEEAIKEIRDASDREVRYGDVKNHNDKVMKRIEAFDMAIKALEQIEIWNATTKDRQIIAPKGTFRKIWEDEQQPCEDCISRTELLARIDAERKHLLNIKMDGAEHIIVHHARRIIEDMPSVTPKTDVLDKIRAEIDDARFINKDTRFCKNALASGLEVAMQIIDKYIEGSDSE